jgi:hypothetical protein
VINDDNKVTRSFGSSVAPWPCRWRPLECVHQQEAGAWGVGSKASHMQWDDTQGGEEGEADGVAASGAELTSETSACTA